MKSCAMGGSREGTLEVGNSSWFAGKFSSGDCFG
jgi:hypothetical protein